MPLVRYALYAQGIDVYIAPTYDSGDRWIATLQHIAREAGCWVVGSGVAFRASDIRSAAPGLADLYPGDDEWINAGDSAVIAPSGKVAVGPLRNDVGILYVDIDSQSIVDARRTLDVTGHYSRPDLFSLHVRTGPLNPVEFVAPANPRLSAHHLDSVVGADAVGHQAAAFQSTATRFAARITSLGISGCWSLLCALPDRVSIRIHLS